MKHRKFKVLIDDQIFRKQKIGGISNYFLYLLKEFEYISDFKVNNGVFLCKSEKFQAYGGEKFVRYNSRIWAIPAIFINFLKMLLIRPDIIHSTFYSRWSFALLSRRDHVVTIHDMIPEDYPDSFQQGNPNKFKSKYIRDAKGIIVVSQYTFERLMYHFPNLDCPISIIPLASGFELNKTDNFDLERKFQEKSILFVGPRGGHKNFEILMNSLEKLIKIIPDISLTCIGGGIFNSFEVQSFEKLGIERHIRHLECNDEELRQQFLNCSLYISTSIAEGFGLPSIEAASMFTPVIVGQNSYLGRLLPDNFVIFDPFDEVELIKKIQNLLLDFNIYESSANSAYEKVQNLTWVDTANSTSNFYQFVLRNSARQRPHSHFVQINSFDW